MAATGDFLEVELLQHHPGLTDYCSTSTSLFLHRVDVDGWRQLQFHVL